MRAYLVSTVRNLSITALRKRNKQNQYAFGDDGTALDRVISEDASPMDVVLRNAEIESLIAGLRKLPERDRWLLEMKYFRRMRDAECPATGDSGKQRAHVFNQGAQKAR